MRASLHRISVPLPFLALLALLATALPAAEDFRELKKSFHLAFRVGQPAAERLRVVKALGEIRNKDSAALLAAGIPLCDGIIEDLAGRKRAVDAENDKLGGDYRSQIESKRMKGLLDEEFAVLDAIEAALTGMRGKRTIEYLARDALLKAKHWKVREMAARALREIADPTTYRYLLRALADKDERVRVTAAGVVAKLEIPEALEGLAKLLEEKSWTVRHAAIEALGSIGARRAVGPLIEQIGEETGRLREDCAAVLEKLTGQGFGPFPDAWRRWWKEHREEYEGDGELPMGEVNPEKPAEPDDTYYGIPLRTRMAIFILDISHSMAYSMKDAQELPKGDELSKIEAAKRQLIRTLGLFDSEGSFDVFAFNDRVFTWKPKMTPSTPGNRLDVKAWVKALEPASTTNIYEALEKAFRIAGMGVSDKRYALGADTIFLLSDGTPTNPDGTDDDPMKVIRAVRQWNRVKRVRIHAIGFSGHNIEFMTQLAEENGGRYVRR